eukprot:767806-Hanusia_phi.AAC.3
MASCTLLEVNADAMPLRRALMEVFGKQTEQATFWCEGVKNVEDLPVGRIDSMWEDTHNDSAWIEVTWFYRPNELHCGKLDCHGKFELFEGNSSDEIEINSVKLHVCPSSSLICQRFATRYKSSPTKSTSVSRSRSRRTALPSTAGVCVFSSLLVSEGWVGITTTWQGRLSCLSSSPSSRSAPGGVGLEC